MEIPPDYLRLFDRLTALYLTGRYPSYKQKLSKLVNRQEAQEVLELSKKAFRLGFTPDEFVEDNPGGVLDEIHHKGIIIFENGRFLLKRGKKAKVFA